jgi:heat shock protein 4
MEALGIDIGSQKTVLTKIAKGGVEIVLSDSSNRATPSIIGYTAEERLIGDSAVNQMKKNFKNTMQFFTRFIGLNADCKDQLEEEKKFITYKTVELENKKIGIECLIRGEKYVLTPEQVLGFYLKKLRTLFNAADCAGKEVVITVPSYFSNAERVAVLDACEIAGIKCNRVLNESTAICLQYGFFRKKDLDAKVPRKVAFVDYGHSKLTITYAEFTSEKVKILGHHSNRNMGARQIDYILFQELGKIFEKKYGCDPRTNVRCRLRMLEGIEKMRKILSSNSEASINLESLMEDEDLNKTFKRADLEELIDPVISDFYMTLKESVEKFGKYKFFSYHKRR